MNIYEILEKLNIKYEEIEHNAVYTVEEASKLKEQIDGLGCKNLFLTDKKNNYFLYILKEDKRADLKVLATYLKVSKLTFASEYELYNILKLTVGSVTPLGLINDTSNQTILIIDKDLVGKKLLVHPNSNTKTIAISYEDLIKYIEFAGNDYFLV